MISPDAMSLFPPTAVFGASYGIAQGTATRRGKTGKDALFLGSAAE
jgi:hypothetical protein